ncbi:uncharacterized protein [Aristolochia californica]|uniref:uncharacterized protein n=1 Tax=Aristolochia californica TaxID=171875 RepID=UPI0035D9C5E9
MSSIAQPVVVYPHSVSTRPSSHTKGSFGPVFIVLAIITVLSMIACIIGRIFGDRFCRSKPQDSHPFQRKGDPENGFHTRYAVKPKGNGERNAKVTGNGEFRQARPVENEDVNAESKPVETGNAAKQTA